MAQPGVFDKGYFQKELGYLDLDTRHEICVLMLRRTSKNEDIPDFVRAAREYYGRTYVESLDWMKRYALYKVMQWLYQNNTRIIHHKAMKDNNMVSNFYKWESDEYGNLFSKYDDWKDYDLLSEEEQVMLCIEFEYEWDKKYKVRKLCEKRR